MNDLYPLLFSPVLKDYVWGGRNLELLFDRALPPGIIAESWEIAAHPDGASVVRNGRFANQTLPQVHQQLGLELLGTNSQWAQERGKFPLLIKLLDAQQNLSVQVHPNDDYAQKHEGNELGKSEMWVVLHAQPDAAIIYGVTEGTTPDKFRQAIADGKLEPYLHRVSVRTGDVVCVPAGTLHAILGGTVIAEIQQNSNTTYRVYDWNRKTTGKPRPLHVDKALDVINFAQVEPSLCQPELVSDEEGVKQFRLCANRYFVTERVEMAAGSEWHGVCDGRTFEIWGCVAGTAVLNHTPLPAISFTLLPAALGPFTVQAATSATLLRTYVM